MTKYFEMHIRVTEFNDGNDFAIDFGDFDREVVEQEIEDRVDSWDEGLQRDLRKKDFKIVTTDEKTEAELQAAAGEAAIEATYEASNPVHQFKTGHSYKIEYILGFKRFKVQGWILRSVPTVKPFHRIYTIETETGSTVTFPHEAVVVSSLMNKARI